MDVLDGGLSGLDEDTLYDIGRRIGEISENRPDITHRILVGIRDGMADAKYFSGYGFGELLEALERHYWSSCSVDQDVAPSVPFVKSNTLSGSGQLQFQIVSRRRAPLPCVSERLPVAISSYNVVVDVSDSLYEYAKRQAGKPFDPNTPRVTEGERRIIKEGRLLGE